MAADLIPALGDEKGTCVVEKLDGLDLVLFVHHGYRLAHQLNGLVDQLIQQIVDVEGDVFRLALSVPLWGGDRYQRADGTWVAVPVVIINGTIAIALPAFGGAVNVTFVVAQGTPSTTVSAAAAASPRT